jgi:hypothetical protein
LHSGAERGFAEKPGYGGLIVAEFFTQDFHGYFAVLGMLGAIDRCRTALANAVEEGVAGQRCSDERVARHAGEANQRGGGSQAKKCEPSRVE